MESLGLGRPTLRQAARLLEQQQLVVVRRGIRGGIFGRRPNAEGVTANAAVFLRSQRTTFGDLLNAEVVLGPACAQLAASNPSDDERRSLTTHYAEADGPMGVRQFMQTATGFQREVARRSKSPVLYLFVSVLMDLAVQSGGVAHVYEDPDRRAETVRRHERIAEAIRDGDARLAASRMKSHLESIIATCSQRTLAQTLGPRNGL
jgi:DNA-binding FadR family transcriptional regulator